MTVSEFEENFRCLYRPLGMYALRYTRDVDEAEDIVQQAFTDIWEKLSSGMEIANLKAYMYQVVHNRSLTFVAEHANIIHDNIPEMEDDMEERISTSERDARLWTAIDKLPPQRQKIFLLSKRDGLTYQEIAEELNLSVKTVEHQISKALKVLRDTAYKIYLFFFG